MSGYPLLLSSAKTGNLLMSPLQNKKPAFGLLPAAARVERFAGAAAALFPPRSAQRDRGCASRAAAAAKELRPRPEPEPEPDPGSSPRPPPAHGPPPGPCVPSPAGGARTEDGAEENSRTSGLPPFVQGAESFRAGLLPRTSPPRGD